MLLLILRELSSLAALACGNEGRSGNEGASMLTAGMAAESSIGSVADVQLLVLEDDRLDWLLDDEEQMAGHGSEEFPLEIRV